MHTVVSKCYYPYSFHWLNLLGLGLCHAKLPLSYMKVLKNCSLSRRISLSFLTIILFLNLGVTSEQLKLNEAEFYLKIIFSLKTSQKVYVSKHFGVCKTQNVIYFEIQLLITLQNYFQLSVLNVNKKTIIRDQLQQCGYKVHFITIFHKLGNF